MAIRFGAAGDSLIRARLTGAKTIMAWVYISASRNYYSGFFGVGDNELVITGPDGTTLMHYDGDTERGGTNLSVGTWYHLAYASAGDTIISDFVVYLNGVSDIANVARPNQSSGTNMYLGNDFYEEWLDGRLAHIKIWSAQLTAAEVRQEMYTIRPQRLANLWSWMPTIEIGNNRNNEWSGYGNTWTATGTLTDEAGPPISWGAPVWAVPFVSVGGGAQEVDVTDSGAGSDAMAQLIVSLGLSDIGAGSEGFGGAASVPTVDAGSAADVLAQLRAALALSDTGGGVDTPVGAAASVPVADTGAGLDSQAITVTLGVADTGAGVDGSFSSILAALADGGFGEDAIISLSARVPVVESGTGGETLSAVASVSIADAGSVADAVDLLTEALKQIAESGAGIDTVISPLVTLSLSDSSTGADSQAINASLWVPESGAGVENATVSVTLAIGDSASAADALVLLVGALKQVAESGAGTDVVLVPAIRIGVAENASGGESLSMAVTLAVGESGAGSEAAAVIASLTVADMGTGQTAISVLTSTLVALFETAPVAESIAVAVSPFAVADAGAGNDATTARVVLALSDAAVGADGLLAAVLVAVSDAAAAVDGVGAIVVNVPVADIGQAADALVSINAVLALLDLGAGVDVSVVFDSTVRLVRIAFAVARRLIIFAWLARSVEFSLSAR